MNTVCPKCSQSGLYTSSKWCVPHRSVDPASQSFFSSLSKPRLFYFSQKTWSSVSQVHNLLIDRFFILIPVHHFGFRNSSTFQFPLCLHKHDDHHLTLVVPSVQRSTLGDRAFPVAASRAWNSLPPAIRTVSSFTSFRQQLKTYLFRLSFC